MKKPNVYNPQIIVSNFNNGKPYYGILYYDIDDREWHEGYGSYYLDYVIEWLNNDMNIISKDIEFIPRDRGNYGIEKAIIKKFHPEYSEAEIDAYIKGYEEKELEQSNS